METNIIYKYRAPGAPPSDDRTITTRTMDVNPNELLRAPHAVGETVTLAADDPEFLGGEPKEYIVLYRWPFLTQFVEPGGALSMLFVIVTDLDA